MGLDAVEIVMGWVTLVLNRMLANYLGAATALSVSFYAGRRWRGLASRNRWTTRVRSFRSYIFAVVTMLSTLGWVNLQAFSPDGASVSFKELVGDYYFGDGLGVNCRLTLSKQGKFAFVWDGCLGTYGENKGSARVRDGVLHLAPVNPNAPENLGTPTDFFPVPWGARLYLIPTNKIVEFCSAVNQGDEPRREDHGDYYLRGNDWAKAVAGRPIVPWQWTRYLLDKPVTGKITELITKQEAWLDLGAEHGILQGMVLNAKTTMVNIKYIPVKVGSVEKSRCRIRCEWMDFELVVGQAVSSGFHE
jgi:hypothetical protein